MQQARRSAWVVLEHARVGVSDGLLEVTARSAGTAPAFTVPLGAASVCALGPGCSITHDAVRWLTEAGTVLCWTGPEGTPVFAHGTGVRDTTRMARQARCVGREDRHAALARRLWRLRTGLSSTAPTIDALRGEEGAWMQQRYLAMAARYQVAWVARTTGCGWDALDAPNRALSVATPLLYGVMLQVCLAAGVAPGLGILHVHTNRALVFDLADLWKAGWLLPIAWRVLADSPSADDAATIDRRVKAAVRAAVHRDRIFERSMDAVQRLFDVSLHREDREDPALAGWITPTVEER